MEKPPPYLTLVDAETADPTTVVSVHDEEFAPLPYYPWDERPQTLPLDHDEAATAIHLANGDLVEASSLLKVPTIRLTRLVKQSPRLQRIFDEALGVALAHAASIPLRTLFDPNANQRALEWASKLLLSSRLAVNHPLAPAPAQPSAQQASLQINQQQRSVTFRWRTDADDLPPDDVA
jgi:hypothetical protein